MVIDSAKMLSAFLSALFYPHLGPGLHHIIFFLRIGALDIRVLSSAYVPVFEFLLRIGTLDILGEPEGFLYQPSNMHDRQQKAFSKILIPQKPLIGVIQGNAARLRQHDAAVEAGAGKGSQIFSTGVRAKNESAAEKSQAFARKSYNARFLNQVLPVFPFGR